MESVLNVKKSIQNLTSNEDGWLVHYFTPAEWKLMEGAVKLLVPFRDSIKAWEVEKEPSINRVLERIYTMHSLLDDFIANPVNCNYGKGFARELKKQLDKRFPNLGTDRWQRNVANYIDPTIKGIHTEAAGMLEETKEKIKVESDKIDSTIVEEPVDNHTVPFIQTEEVGLSPNSKLRKRLQSRQQPTFTQTNREEQGVMKEMRKYEVFSIAKKGTKILQWWKNHENVLPLLAKVAKHILSVPASSAKKRTFF
jgi:hypothetical protein